MVRARKPVAPKKWMPKLWKEIMEQNITQWDDLISEAKKYKTADEFVNDNKRLFHTTSELNAQKINSEWFVEWKSKWIWDRLVDWVFFVDNELPLPTITKYSKEPSNIVKWFVSKNSKIKEFKTMDDFENFLLKDEKYISLDDPDLSSKRAKEIFIQNWIDVIIKPYWKWTEYIVVNPKVLKTESQLKQIREQANKKPLPPLPAKWLPKLWKEIMEQNMDSKSAIEKYTNLKPEILWEDEFLWKEINFSDGKTTVQTRIKENPKQIILMTIWSKTSDNLANTAKWTWKWRAVVDALKKLADTTWKELVVPDSTNNALSYRRGIPYLKEWSKGIPYEWQMKNFWNTFYYTPNKKPLPPLPKKWK